MFLIQKVNPSLNTLINFPFSTLSFFWSTFSKVARWRLLVTPVLNLSRLIPKRNQLWTHKWTARPSKGSSILNINVLVSLSKKYWLMKNQISFNHIDSHGFLEKKNAPLTPFLCFVIIFITQMTPADSIAFSWLQWTREFNRCYYSYWDWGVFKKKEVCILCRCWGYCCALLKSSWLPVKYVFLICWF